LHRVLEDGVALTVNLIKGICKLFEADKKRPFWLSSRRKQANGNFWWRAFSKTLSLHRCG